MADRPMNQRDVGRITPRAEFDKRPGELEQTQDSRTPLIPPEVLLRREADKLPFHLKAAAHGMIDRLEAAKENEEALMQRLVASVNKIQRLETLIETLSYRIRRAKERGDTQLETANKLRGKNRYLQAKCRKLEAQIEELKQEVAA